MGFAVVGIATIGMSAIYLITNQSQLVLAFSLGASSLALLAKAGGGIYTKTADIAADLVGKVEVGIPEDDPRNPAVVADNVGDNVGDVAGMGADIFDSYVASAVAAMLLGAAMGEPHYTILPLLLCALGIVASIIGVAMVRVGNDEKPGKALNMGTFITCGAFAALMAIAILLVPQIDNNFIWAILVGTAVGVIIGQTTEFFTSDEYSPVKLTVNIPLRRCDYHHQRYELRTYFYCSIHHRNCDAMLISFFVCGGMGNFPMGIYGVGISAVGMLAVSGMIVSADAMPDCR